MGTYVARASAPEVHGRGAARGAPWGLVTAAVGVVVWLVVYPQTPDLAGQVYRADLFHEAGFLVYDSRWYGGHNVPAYSLVFPPLAAWLGVRAVGAAAVLASATLFERAARAVYGPPARWAAVWFAVAALGDVWSGRVTFALGVSVALGAVLALVQDRPAAAAALAGVCAACSPVAGVLLALAGLTYSLAARTPRSLVVLGVPPAVVVATLVGLFPEGGWEPYPLYSFLATLAAIAGYLWAMPAQRRVEWVGGVVYLAVCVACVAVHSPVGANVERYGVLLVGPLLLCALLSSGRRLSAAAVAVLCGIAVWTVWGPARETAAVAGNASTSASYYLPVERFVAGVEAPPGRPVRVEVPFTRGHWEAAWLAGKVALARGWEKQLDERYDSVLLSKDLTAARYRAWLKQEAVSYVALPDAPLDPSSAVEGRLIEAGLAYLHEVERTQHWRIYEVVGATPLAQGPGTLSGLGHNWFALRARTAGSFTVRVRYTRYWTVTQGAACVGRAPGGWTAVTARRAGAVRVAASFSIGRALGLDGQSCRAG